MWSLDIFITFLVCVGVALFLIPKIIKISKKKHLYDACDERKLHEEQISRLGGISFVPTILAGVATYLFVFHIPEGKEIQELITWQHAMILGAFLVIFAAGVVDDVLQIGYRLKFIAQLLAATLVVLSGLYINTLYGFFGIEEIIPTISMPLTVLFIMTCINAYNLIDGIDGLCSGIAIVSLVAFYYLFPFQDINLFTLLTISTLGALFVFFCFNVFGKTKRNRKIFMGDCGSQTVGLLLSVLAIHYSTQPLYTTGIPTENKSIAVCIALLMIPIFDVVRIIIHRLREHKNPFLPDRNHIHHKFLALGLSQRSALMVILGMTIFFLLLNIGLQNTISITLLLLLDIIFYTLLNIGLTFLIKKKEAK